jgi:hypothetical protein
MKVKFFCNSGANIHSCRESVFDTVKDLCLEEGEWEKMSEDDKFEMARDWANNRLEIGYEEL